MTVFDHASKRYLDSWHGYALSYTHNWTDAEDVVHDATARTLSADSEFATVDDVHRYMMRVVRTVAFDFLGSRGRDIPLGDIEPVAPHAQVDPARRFEYFEELAYERSRSTPPYSASLSSPSASEKRYY